MIVDLSNMMKYRNVVQALKVYGRGDSIGESIYLNFEDGYLYFSSDTFKARIRFSYTMDEGDSYENRFVDIDKLMTLVSNFPSLYLDCSTFTFKNPDDKREQFRISNFEEECDLPELFDVDGWDSYELTPESISYLGEAINFVNQENTHYNGVMFNKSKLIAATKEGYYEVDLDEEFLSPLKLHESLVRLLIRLEEGVGVNIFYSNKKTLVQVGNDLEVLTARDVNMDDIPDPEDPNFVSEYDHDNYIVIPRRELSDTLSFMNVFTKDLVNGRIQFEVSEDGKELIVKTEDVDKVNRYVKLDECLGAEGFSDWYMIGRLRLILASLKSDFIKVQLSQEKVTANFSEIPDDEDEESTKHVVLPKLIDE